MSHPDPRQVPGLFVETLRNLTSLVQTELALAKSEVTHNISRAGVGIAFFAVAGILALVALNVLAGAFVAYLASTGLSAGTAALIVGGVVLLLAVILVFAGKSRLTASALAPTHTIHNIQRDVSAVKGATNG